MKDGSDCDSGGLAKRRFITFKIVLYNVLKCFELGILIKGYF